VTRRIRVLVVGTDSVHPETIRDDYREYNRLVRGGITSLSLPPALARRGFYAFCDDDGREHQQLANAYGTHLGHHDLRGPIVLFRRYEGQYDPEDERDGQDLSDDELLYLEAYFLASPSSEARAAAREEQKFWEAHPSGMAFHSFDSLTDFEKWLEGRE